MLIVTAPAPDRTLLTIEDLRAAVGVTDGSKDALLTRLGNQVAAGITSACHVARAGAQPPTLRLETLTETFRVSHHHGGLHGHELLLARRPIASVASVTIDRAALDASDYEADAAAGILRRIDGAWHGRLITVVYDAGYATVPDDLAFAARQYVQLLYWQDGRDPNLSMEMTEGIGRQQWFANPNAGTAIPPSIMQLLEAGGYVEHWV